MDQQPHSFFLPSNPPHPTPTTTTSASSSVTVAIDRLSETHDDSGGPTFIRLGDCAYYSTPFVILDVLWNFAFVVVAVYVLFITGKEKPSTPLRLWIGGYALQCVLHVGFIWVEFQKRNLDADFEDDHLFEDQDSILVSLLCHSSIIKGLESMHTVVSSVWWVFGFYWIVMGGQSLLQDAPRLYWLAVVFLAFDVFFMIFCIAMACAILFSMFCFFPVLASVAYAMKIGEGASEDDLKALPKFRYDQPSSGARHEDVKQRVNLVAELSNSNVAHELSLHPDDSECCICLHKYVHGAELCALPCNHHFHYNCISKWLQINATCPLCKCNILSGDSLV